MTEKYIFFSRGCGNLLRQEQLVFFITLWKTSTCIYIYIYIYVYIYISKKYDFDGKNLFELQVLLALETGQENIAYI